MAVISALSFTTLIIILIAGKHKLFQNLIKIFVKVNQTLFTNPLIGGNTSQIRLRRYARVEPKIVSGNPVPLGVKFCFHRLFYFTSFCLCLY